jgi:excisionase family DNA binding protein
MTQGVLRCVMLRHLRHCLRHLALSDGPISKKKICGRKKMQEQRYIKTGQNQQRGQTMTKQGLLAGGLEKVSKAAKRLGIDRNTLYKWCLRGKVPYTHIHGVYRIPSLAVDEMLVAGLNIGPALEDQPR